MKQHSVAILCGQNPLTFHLEKGFGLMAIFLQLFVGKKKAKGREEGKMGNYRAAFSAV